VSEPYDRPRWDVEGEEAEERAGDAPLRPGPAERHDETLPGVAPADDADELERASENVLEGWPEPVEEPLSSEDVHAAESARRDADAAHDATAAAPSPAADEEHEPVSSEQAAATLEHAPGDLVVPPGVPVLEGSPRGERRAVGIVVSRFNGEVTSLLLDSALAELEALGVAPDAVTVMPVPGAFELPLAAMALAKTRRFACVVALGCVIRGDTPHFDFICAEAASGIQLAGIETGVPVAFGVLTLDRAHQAEARIEKGAESVRTALEMADLFANLRAAAAR
jgi:6,7-dimethyl-8-ribityllumazine synthase